MRLSRYADLLPLGVFAILVGFVAVLDHEWSGRAERRLAEEEQVAARRIGVLAEALGNAIAERMGSLEAAKSSFIAANATEMGAAAETTLVAALDSTTTRMQGLTSISIVVPESEALLRAPGTGFGRLITLSDSALRPAYVRAVATHSRAGSSVVDYGVGRRVFVFDPILNSDSSRVTGVIAAELDPQTIYRSATGGIQLDTIGQGASSHTLIGPGGVRLSTPQGVPRTWARMRRDVPVADTHWQVELAYPLPDLRSYRAERIALWVAGLALALAFAVILYFLRRTITTQGDEIARRQAAEDAARTAAGEARARAKQARELAAQLEAAQKAAQRLSTSLDPDDVVELFLGGVAEILGADVASLYTFEEEGELLVGRRRMIFREVKGITEPLAREDIRQVRAPVALLPSLGEAVSTGEPYVVEAGRNRRRVNTRAAAADAISSSVTVPLLIAGHTVGVASWEVYDARTFPPELIVFAQALAAPAAAALRTAELFLSLETQRRSTAREALRFGAVLDQMADGVIVVDAHGHLERSNASAAELLGSDLESVPMEEWPARFDLVSVDGRPLAPAEFPLARALRGEAVRRATFIVRSDWGAERHLSGSAAPIRSEDGTPAGAAMVLRDVSDEHQYAEMLRHTNRELRRQADVLEQVNQQLREATKAKDQFLAVMSHELRTPINAVMGYSDLLDLGVKGPLNDEQRAMLARVRETSRHLLGLINEVLDLAKIGAGRMDLVMTDVEIGRIVDRAAQQIQPQAAAKGLTLHVRGPAGGRPVAARGDETRITQIIVNLLSNAVKFTADGGVTITYQEADGRIVIRVTDTGPGIPEEHAERIFEEFYQVEGGLSRASGGTGLGLAIARRFARLMNGDITVESEPGDGSTFTLELQGTTRTETGSAETDEPVVILLGHDDDAIERLSEDLSGTLRVHGTTEPAEFARLARRGTPQLLAIDARAPGQAAWRALAALRSEQLMPARLLLYAHQDDAAETSVDLGYLTMLRKPVPVEHVTDLVMSGRNGTPAVVLIADDDPEMRRVLGAALTAAGCDVRTASSGGEALDLARRLQPDVAVVDLLMPGMDGIEAISVMRGEPALQSARVIGTVSGDLTDAEMQRLTASIANVGRGNRGRTRTTAQILREAAGLMAPA